MIIYEYYNQTKVWKTNPVQQKTVLIFSIPLTFSWPNFYLLSHMLPGSFNQSAFQTVSWLLANDFSTCFWKSHNIVSAQEKPILFEMWFLISRNYINSLMGCSDHEVQQRCRKPGSRVHLICGTQHYWGDLGSGARLMGAPGTRNILGKPYYITEKPVIKKQKIKRK